MGVVYFELSMSLDGFIAGPNVSIDNGLGDGGEQLHDWMFEGKTGEESTEFGRMTRSSRKAGLPTIS